MMKEVKVMGEVMDEEASEDGKPEYDKWDLQCKANTLIEAEEIKADAGLMEALKPYLEKKAKAYNSVAQLRELATKKSAEDKTAAASMKKPAAKK